MATNPFSVLRTADVLPGHFGRFFGYGRVSVSHWLNGHKSPHELHRVKVFRDLQAVHTALKLGDLPVPSTPRKNRYERVERALKRAIKAQKNAR
jgi:hypothetical protein